MKYPVTAIACGFAFMFIVMSKAAADPESCREAIEQYNSAKSDVSDAIRRYASCVRDSAGKDDCSSEFAELQSAHDDFDSAVSSYSDECS